uniref:Beta-galactosidase n=1 Tax=Arion vulgaris TaxID=1028688 RepID=A0A0B7ART6_9EUPU
MTTLVMNINIQMFLLLFACNIAFDSTQAKGTYEIDYQNNTFLKDGQPFRYISGSMHYSRVHPYYWEDRLLKMRLAGLNAVQTYVPWNVHEIKPGLFNWEGFSDLGKFLTLAQRQDLLVLLRLGPYICGEWEFGGFPAWLLSEDPNMVLRTSNTSYLKWVDKWYTTLLDYVKPYLYNNGGPVIMVQIENEYGSYFACDSIYMSYLLKKVKSLLGDVVVYTTDGCGLHYLYCGKSEGAYATVDFGPTDKPEECFAAEKFFELQGPMVNSEYYTGWLDHWGQPHSKGNTTLISKSLDAMLATGANINMYMFVGGTNFGFMNGANSPPYQPVPTSYDYDAPISEAGDLTPKYFAIRDIVSKYNELPRLPIPPNTNKSRYGKVNMEFTCIIQDALPYLTPDGPLKFTYPVPMEQIMFYFGFILYRFVLTTNYSAPTALHCVGIRDMAIVMVNAVPFGKLDRDTTTVNITGALGVYVDILVENQGRIGFGSSINLNAKGIIANVTLGGKTVTDWLIYPLNIENINFSTAGKIKTSVSKPFKSADGTLMTPSIYVCSIFIPHTPYQPQDTFLDPQHWGKGQAIVNDFNIGRYWPGRGPQVTLYIPKPFLNKEPELNFLYLLELEHAPCPGDSTCYVTLTDVPYLDGPNKLR